MNKYYIKGKKETIEQLENKYKGQMDLKKLIRDSLETKEYNKNTQVIKITIEITEF